MKSKATIHTITLIGIVLASVILGWALTILPITTVLLESLNNRFYDIILVLSQPDLEEDSLDDVIIIDMDEKSISTLGQFSSWPNIFFVDALNYLSSGNPTAIGFDVFFSEPDSLQPFAINSLTSNIASKTKLDTLVIKQILRNESTDLELATAVQNAGNVFLAMFNKNEETTTQIVLPEKLKAWSVQPRQLYQVKNPVPPIPILAQAAYGIGFAHIEPNRSGITLDYPLFFQYQDKNYLNFSFQMCMDLLGIDNLKQTRSALELYKGKELIRKLPLDENGKLYLKYYGKGRTFRTVSFSDIVLKRLPSDYFNGKILLFGSSATGLYDLKTTPLDSHYPGVELHATLMKNVLDGDFVHFIPNVYLYLVSVVILLILIFIITRYHPRAAFITYAAFMIISLSAFLLLYHYASLCLNYAAFLLPWNIGFAATIFYQFQLHLKDKRSYRNAFEHYVAKDVVKQIIDDPTQLKVGGKLSPVSALFSDLRDFTYICQQTPPDEVVKLLNDYFNRVTPLIIKSNGMLDKFIGDAVVALFNVPIPKANYPYDACMAAIQIIRVADAIRKENEFHPVYKIFKNGIGITTGEMIVGNMGASNIFSYTGIGDIMNLASRLEGLNKFYHTRILVDENTYNAVKGKLIIRKIDCVAVKGRTDCTTIYEVMGTDSTPEESLKLCAQMYEIALNDYMNGKWKDAIKHFDALLKQFPNDGPSVFLRERILKYHGVAFEHFKGVWDFDEK